MHEMSLVESLKITLEEQARIHDFKSVKTVWLEVGPFSNVEPESLLFCFDVVMKDSIAQGARLEIIRPPGQGWCMSCMTEVAVNDRTAPCPLCEGGPVIPQGGDALRIHELEVD